jgi:hypothetical protein
MLLCFYKVLCVLLRALTLVCGVSVVRQIRMDIERTATYRTLRRGQIEDWQWHRSRSLSLSYSIIIERL